ncbi:hypothetical protein MKW92_044202 [Papaver armeniacum]|nr:hypothetical protein MKW92_044202 [Papaver armeniacum]
MDGFKGQGGVQMLLSAEQEAQQIVAMKNSRLKQAVEEADREIAQDRQVWRPSTKNRFETSGNSGMNVKRLEEETVEKIKSLKDMSSKVSKDVVAMLMRQVTTVKN